MQAAALDFMQHVALIGVDAAAGLLKLMTNVKIDST
jgi:hypothetical protein